MSIDTQGAEKMGTVRQIEIEGTERKYSKAMKDAAGELQNAIAGVSRWQSKKKDAHAKALQQMKNDGLSVYVDTESDTPFKLEVLDEQRVKKSAYKPPKPEPVEEPDDK